MAKITNIERTAKSKIVLLIDDKQITVVQNDNKPKAAKSKIVYPHVIKDIIL